VPATVVVERHVEVPMRDGTVLRADVWRPAQEGRWPVLLQRTPYDRSLSLIATAGLEPLRAAEAGFAVVIQDVRGRFTSDGVFRPFEQEIDDGADTVAWAAAAPFSNGVVGMYGGSYFGATQLLAASTAPPALRAISPQLTASDYHEGWTYQGGALQLGFVLLWGFGLAA
jgi:putative CocE/NonD family hydrolase